MNTLPDDPAAKAEAAVKLWRKVIDDARHMKWDDPAEQQLVITALEAKRAKAEEELGKFFPSAADELVDGVLEFVAEYKRRRAEERRS